MAALAMALLGSLAIAFIVISVTTTHQAYMRGGGAMWATQVGYAFIVSRLLPDFKVIFGLLLGFWLMVGAVYWVNGAIRAGLTRALKD